MTKPPNEQTTSRWWLISDQTYRLIKDLLKKGGQEDIREALHQLDSGLHTTEQISSDYADRPLLETLIDFDQKNLAQGFGYRNKSNAIIKFEEEFHELLLAIKCESKQRQEEELGDLLYMIASICRLFGLNPANSVEAITNKLRFRVEKMRSLSPVPIGDLSDDEQTEFLQQVKRSHKSEARSQQPEARLSNFLEPDEVDMLINALEYYDQTTTNPEDRQKLLELVSRVEGFKMID
jgi:NTP pyrophosphatase (non-canonical NTP hydrolase)